MHKEALKDLIKHTSPFYDVVKVYNDNGKTKFLSSDDGNTILMSGSFNNYHKELDNASVGINRMPTLKGMLNFGLFNEQGSSYNLVMEGKDGVDKLAEIHFESPYGHKSTYRFMGSRVVDSQLKTHTFKGAQWDVSFRPTLKLVSELSHFAAILGGNDCKFVASTLNGKLAFNVGSHGNDRATIPICDTTGVLKKNWSWGLLKFISVLKLADDEACTVHISNQAVMMIEIESKYASYQFILPSTK
jgi:hypothetical protein